MNQPPPDLPSSATGTADIKALQREVNRLQGQLKQASLRADAYEEMINVVNIAIRKKAGVKR